MPKSSSINTTMFVEATSLIMHRVSIKLGAFCARKDPLEDLAGQVNGLNL